MIEKRVKACLHVLPKSAFFVSGTFDLFNVKCKQCYRTVLNLILNGTKNGDVDGTCKRSVTLDILRTGGRLRDGEDVTYLMMARCQLVRGTSIRLFLTKFYRIYRICMIPFSVIFKITKNDIFQILKIWWILLNSIRKILRELL